MQSLDVPEQGAKFPHLQVSDVQVSLVPEQAAVSPHIHFPEVQVLAFLLQVTPKQESRIEDSIKKFEMRIY